MGGGGIDCVGFNCCFSFKIITVAMRPSKREVSLCRVQSAIVATIGIYYGDELSRQGYRRQLQRKSAQRKRMPSLSEANPLKHVNFDVKYLHEELCTSHEGRVVE